MNPASDTAATRGSRSSASLLERAAQVYDFGAELRARRPAPAVAAPTPEVEAEPAFAQPPAFEPVFAPDSDFASAPLPVPGAPAAIDRLMLAEKGMIVPGAPIGPLAEEFRQVKRQLLVTRERIAATGDETRARTLLVCSAKPGDGKTFCAINLALSLAAERDLEVLLVDADFAKPDVMRQLGLNEGPGLLDALADDHLDVETLVMPTDVPHLAVLPVGTQSVSDTELLASARTRTVLARLLAANPRRIVVFDSPPALAASPAGVLAMIVGQVMMVVRADRTPESDLAQAVGLLDACEHISLVLNAVSFVAGSARFGSYYGQEDRA